VAELNFPEFVKMFDAMLKDVNEHNRELMPLATKPVPSREDTTIRRRITEILAQYGEMPFRDIHLLCGNGYSYESVYTKIRQMYADDLVTVPRTGVYALAIKEAP